MKRFLTSLTALGFAPTAANSHAITIQSIGALADNAGNEITEWATTTTAKSFDADGDNMYGSDGWDLFGVSVNHTSYNQFVSIGPGIQIVGPFPGYTVVDVPGQADQPVELRRTERPHARGLLDVNLLGAELRTVQAIGEDADAEAVRHLRRIGDAVSDDRFLCTGAADAVG